MTVPNHQGLADLDLLALAGLTLVMRCGRCRTRLDMPPRQHADAGGFLWPCPTCEPGAYTDGFWVPTKAPVSFTPGDVRFVETPHPLAGGRRRQR